MKTIKATGKYAVSFNTRIGGYEVGECEMSTIDFAGDDIEVLAKEVIDDDPDFPMTFEHVWSETVVGVFRESGVITYDQDVCAVMFRMESE